MNEVYDKGQIFGVQIWPQKRRQNAYIHTLVENDSSAKYAECHEKIIIICLW